MFVYITKENSYFISQEDFKIAKIWILTPISLKYNWKSTLDLPPLFPDDEQNPEIDDDEGDIEDNIGTTVEGTENEEKPTVCVLFYSNRYFQGKAWFCILFVLYFL